MNKRDDFLWIVQTAILTNGVNLAADETTRVNYKDVYSSTGVRIVMREAVRASYLIPDSLDAADAADEFCLWMLRNHQEALQKDNPNSDCPRWFAR